MGDLANQVLGFYAINADVILPMLIAIFVIGLALGAGMLSEDRLMRMVLVGIVASIFIMLSFFDFLESEFANEFFLNLGTMMLLALVALLYSGLATIAHDWIYPVGAAAALAVFSVLFINRDTITSDLAGNLAAMFIAAWPIAYFVRQQWQWSPAKRDRKLVKELRSSRHQKALDDANTPDFTLLVQGADADAVEQKVAFLRDSDLKILSAKPIAYDPQADVHYQMVQAKIVTTVKDQDVTLLDNTIARLRILAYPDTAKRVYAQLMEVLTERKRQRLDGPSHLVHFETQVEVPGQLFSDYLEEQIFDLARRWRHGDDELLQGATEALLNWAEALHFIKPTGASD